MSEDTGEMEPCEVYKKKLDTSVLEKGVSIEEKVSIVKKDDKKDSLEIKAELEFDYIRGELFFGEKIDEMIALLDEDNFGTITNSTTAQIGDTDKNWIPNEWKGSSIKFLTGSLEGETYSVSSNTDSTITITGYFTEVPGIGSAYKLFSETTDASTKQLGLDKDSKFNTAVTLDTDIFTTAISTSHASSTYVSNFRIYATFNTAGVLSVQRIYSGTTVEEKLNGGSDLTANCAYVFDVVILEGQTINLQYSAGATALMLAVVEIGGGI